jgi:hypothetical protein
MLFTETAVLAELQLLRGGLFVLGCRVVSLLALGTCKGDDISHYRNSLNYYSLVG